MDTGGGTRPTADTAVPVTPTARDQISQLRRERDALRRENRTLRHAIAELERVSERDTLTPLYNRRYFSGAIQQRIARMQRHPGSVAIVYADVNELKLINDRMGHAAGDFALVEIAMRMAQSIRATDVAARIGGDEFALLLDHADEAGARAQVRRLATILSDHPAMFGGEPVNLSVSFGVAMLRPGMSEADVMAAADADMYGRKAPSPSGNSDAASATGA